MERFLVRQNIAIFKRALETETDLVIRGTLWQLLADAEAALTRLDAQADDPPGMVAMDGRTRTMDRFSLRRNITSFRRILETETNLVTRGTLWQLLSDAEAELAQLEAEAPTDRGVH